MMKKLGAIALLALIFIPAGVLGAGYQGSGGHHGSDCPSGCIQYVPLTDEETYWLTYMREEEKLARDVYIYLDDWWHMRIFQTIAASEQNHMDAIEPLLIRYGVPDPAAGNGEGEFTNDTLQDLYDSLTADGDNSREEALNVGIDIEMKDIEDLDEAMAATTHNDILTVYGNLQEGSKHHLAAFEKQLEKFL